MADAAVVGDSDTAEGHGAPSPTPGDANDGSVTSDRPDLLLDRDYGEETADSLHWAQHCSDCRSSSEQKTSKPAEKGRGLCGLCARLAAHPVSMEVLRVLAPLAALADVKYDGTKRRGGDTNSCFQYPSYTFLSFSDTLTGLYEPVKVDVRFL